MGQQMGHILRTVRGKKYLSGSKKTTANLENLLQNCVILLSHKAMPFVIMMILFFKTFAKTGCYQSKHAANMSPNVI